MSSIIYPVMNDSQNLAQRWCWWYEGGSLSGEGVGTILGRGTITARFHCWGTVPDDRDDFRMSQAGTLSSKANYFKTLFGMLSGPGAVCSFIRESSLHICDLVTRGAGPGAGIYAGRLLLSRAGSEEEMETKWVLITLARSLPSIFSVPGRLIWLFVGRKPLSCLAVAYQEWELDLARDKFCWTNVLLAWSIALLVVFL